MLRWSPALSRAVTLVASALGGCFSPRLVDQPFRCGDVDPRRLSGPVAVE